MSRIRARIERLERELRKRQAEEPGEIVVELVPTHDADGRLLPPVSEVAFTEGDDANALHPSRNLPPPRC